MHQITLVIVCLNTIQKKIFLDGTQQPNRFVVVLFLMNVIDDSISNFVPLWSNVFDDTSST